VLTLFDMLLLVIGGGCRARASFGEYLVAIPPLYTLTGMAVILVLKLIRIFAEYSPLVEAAPAGLPGGVGGG